VVDGITWNTSIWRDSKTRAPSWQCLRGFVDTKDLATLSPSSSHSIPRGMTRYRYRGMNVDVENSIVINRPLSDVSRYAADPDNAPLWYVNIKSVEWLTPRPVQVGSRIAFVAQFLGRRLAYTYEVVEFIPGVRLVMRTSEGPFPMETTYVWESSTDGSTRMALRNRGTPSGFSVWVAPLMAVAMRRANRNDLALLKKRLEERADTASILPSSTEHATELLRRTTPKQRPLDPTPIKHRPRHRNHLHHHSTAGECSGCGGRRCRGRTCSSRPSAGGGPSRRTPRGPGRALRRRRGS
jgi:uncharacterized membrane protein